MATEQRAGTAAAAQPPIAQAQPPPVGRDAGTTAQASGSAASAPVAENPGNGGRHEKHGHRHSRRTRHAEESYSESDDSIDGGPAGRGTVGSGFVRDARPWGAASLPLNASMPAAGAQQYFPGFQGAPQPHPVSSFYSRGPLPVPPVPSAYGPGAARHIPIGIGLPGSSMGTIPAHITSPEHIGAYADYCKRTLHNLVNGSLMSKRDRLLHHLARLAARGEEIRSVSASAERETRAEAEEALEAVRSCESRALLLLQQQSDDISRHLHAVQRCAEEVAAATAASESPLRFLELFRPLHDACERLAARAVREDADGDGGPDGGLGRSNRPFEEELRRAMAAARPHGEAEQLQALLEAKNQMVWSLLEERESLRAAAAAAGAEAEDAKAELAALRAMMGSRAPSVASGGDHRRE